MFLAIAPWRDAPQGCTGLWHWLIVWGASNVNALSFLKSQSTTRITTRFQSRGAALPARPSKRHLARLYYNSPSFLDLTNCVLTGLSTITRMPHKSYRIEKRQGGPRNFTELKSAQVCPTNFTELKSVKVCSTSMLKTRFWSEPPQSQLIRNLCGSPWSVALLQSWNSGSIGPLAGNFWKNISARVQH